MKNTNAQTAILMHGMAPTATHADIPRKVKVMIELSKRQRGMLWMLVRKEAVSLGYGKKYTEENHPLWPPRLKALRIVAAKLRE